MFVGPSVVRSVGWSVGRSDGLYVKSELIYVIFPFLMTDLKMCSMLAGPCFKDASCLFSGITAMGRRKWENVLFFNCCLSLEHFLKKKKVTTKEYVHLNFKHFKIIFFKYILCSMGINSMIDFIPFGLLNTVVLSRSRSRLAKV